VLVALNVRYVITPEGVVNLEQCTGYNPYGAAWLVEEVVRGATPKEELELMGERDLRTTAIVAEDVTLSEDSYTGEGRIELVEYSPNHLKYEYEAEDSQLAIFSEIYFEDGWRAYIDGKQSDYFAADYILRGMELPAGKHTIEWHFRAPKWGLISTIMSIASWLIIAALAAVVGVALYRTIGKKGRE
jgi:hypothetical protein